MVTAVETGETEARRGPTLLCAARGDSGIGLARTGEARRGKGSTHEIRAFADIGLSREMSVLCQRRTHALQQFCRYSITSSARRRIEEGTVRPRALAVLVFTAISNFTGT